MARKGFEVFGEGLKAVKDAVAPVARAGGEVSGGTARAGSNAAVGTAATAAGIVGTALRAVGGIAQRFPKLTFLAATFGAIKGIQALVRRRKDGQEVSEQGAGAETAAQMQGFGGVEGASYGQTPSTAPMGFGQSQAAADAGAPGMAGEPSPQEQRAFLEALLSAAAERQAGEQGLAQGQVTAPTAMDAASEVAGPSWAQRVDASRQPLPGQDQGAGRG